MRSLRAVLSTLALLSLSSLPSPALANFCTAPTPLCAVDELDGYFGTQVGSKGFETENWVIGNGLYPNSTQLLIGQTPPLNLAVPLFWDNCQFDCNSTVTLTVAPQTSLNAFQVVINGWYLEAVTGRWLHASDNPFDIIPDLATVFDLWLDGMVITNTTIDPTSKQPYFTGQYSKSGNVNGFLPPLYKLPPFPHWSCTPTNASAPVTQSNLIRNWVLIVTTLSPTVWAGVTYACGLPNNFNNFVIARSCPAQLNPPQPQGANPQATIHGDPQFAGLRGQDYQVHGIDGGVYNVISDRYMQLNSQFVFLTGPRPCPLMPSSGKKSVACFMHAGSYLSNLALKTNAGDELLILSGPARLGLTSVTLNGQELDVGETAELAFADGRQGSVTWNTTHEVSLTAGLFELEVENSDAFLNLRSVVVRGGNWKELKEEKAHGLLGQTWKVRKGKSAIEGKVDDYLLLSEDLFGIDFIYNRFQVQQ